MSEKPLPTSRKTAKELRSLREREAWVRAVLNSILQPILSLDENGVILDANSAAITLFGYEIDEFVGARIASIIPGLGTLLDSRLTDPGTAPVVTIDQEMQGFRKGQDGVPLRVSFTEMTSENQKVLTVLARDITQERLDRARYLDEARALEASAIHVHLANELHDGLLQSLTGVSLRLEIIGEMLLWDPGSVRDRLKELQASVVDEQRELRFFVDEFKVGTPGWADHDAPLEDRLRRMLDRVENIWDIRCPHAAHVEEEPTVGRAHGILRIVHEAVVNSARHGGATRIELDLSCGTSETTLEVSDNGQGFPFEGRMELDELRERRVGPERLKQRVVEADGWMSIESSPDGVVLVVRLPGG